jgi:hypothetical protein
MSARKGKKQTYPAGVPYEQDLLRRLSDLRYAADYLTGCLSAGGEPEEELEVLLVAIEKIVKSIGSR